MVSLSREEAMARIVFATDIHDAYRALEILLELTDAEVYLLGGDLVYKVFHRYGTAWKYLEIQQMLRGRRLPGEHLLDTARRLREEGAPPQWTQAAKQYELLSSRAKRYLLRSYEMLEGVLSRFPNKRVYAISGNYDMDLRNTPLAHRDLHARCVEVSGLKIAGFGRVEMHTPGVPDHLQLPIDQRTIQWELSQLRRCLPDVIVTHQPPYGLLDSHPGSGHVGLPRLRDMIEEIRPAMVLSGHVHEDWGVESIDGTVSFNPSNFGPVVGVSRTLPGGYFFHINVEGRLWREATLKRIHGRRVVDILVYQLRDGDLERTILDEAQYHVLFGKKKRERHIRPLQRVRKIRNFFLAFETDRTKELVGQLSEICKELEGQGMEVAFDLLGSLNFGLARGESDVDLVVYLRGRDCKPDSMDVCSIPLPLASVFERLREHRVEVEVCDSLDLDRVERAILSEDFHDEHLQRFVFYRAVCREVNPRPIKRVETKLVERPWLRRRLEDQLREYIQVMVSSVRHRSSFHKYLQRLNEAGKRVDEEVLREIDLYLKGK